MKRIKEFIAGKSVEPFTGGPALTLAGEILHWASRRDLYLRSIGIIPLAAYIGEATEGLASYTNPRWARC